MARATTPSPLQSLALEPETRQTLEQLANGTVAFPAYGKTGLLLYGTNGTGKTTTAQLMPALLEPVISARNGAKSQPLNALSNYFFNCEQGQNGAALTEQLRNILMLSSWNASGRHYIILDEVDNLTKAAMSSLKNLMNSSFAVFLLTTNNLSAIEKGVISRSHLLGFNAAPVDAQIRWAKQWCRNSNLCTPPNVKAIVEACDGDLRNLQSDLALASAQLTRKSCNTTNRSAA